MAPRKYYTLSGPFGSQQLLEDSLAASSGSSDEGRIVALNADGKLDPSQFPPGVGPIAVSLTAFENLPAGRLVQMRSDGQVQLADAATGKQADGFVLTTIASAATGLVYFAGIISGLTGLTPAQKFFVGASGQLTTTPTVTSGYVIQEVAKAITSTTAAFYRSTPTYVA